MPRPVTRLRPALMGPALAAAVLVVALLAGCSGSPGGSAAEGTNAVSATSRLVPASPPSTPWLSEPPSASPPSTAQPSTAQPSTGATSETAPSEAPAGTPAAPTPSSAPAGPPPIAGSPLVVLNPGHNGGNSSRPDIINALVPAGNGTAKACDTAGTTTVDGYPEHAFTFDVATRVAALLADRGVRVELTRPDDTGVGPCVDERAALGNGPDVAAVVSIHADGAPEDGHGFHISRASVPPAGPDIAADSDRLTTAVHDAMAASSGLATSTYLGSNGYFPRSDLAGLSLAQRPATFLECGNMKNPGDAALLASADGRAQIAAAIAAGILAYLAG